MLSRKFCHRAMKIGRGLPRDRTFRYEIYRRDALRRRMSVGGLLSGETVGTSCHNVGFSVALRMVSNGGSFFCEFLCGTLSVLCYTVSHIISFFVYHPPYIALIARQNNFSSEQIFGLYLRGILLIPFPYYYVRICLMTSLFLSQEYVFVTRNRNI